MPKTRPGRHRAAPRRSAGAVLAAACVLAAVPGSWPVGPAEAAPSPTSTPQDWASAGASAPATERGVLNKRWRVVDALHLGAAGDGRTDDTAALQRALDGLAPGSALLLPAGRTFAHSGVLRLRVAGTALVGRGTLLATDPARSALWVEGDATEVSDVTLEVRGASQRLGTWDDVGLRVAGTRWTTVRGVTVKGAASAGVMVDGASRFTLRGVVVEDSLADGIHITDGSHDGTLVGVTTRRTGDDGVAVVSYRNLPAVHDVVITAPRVEGTTWGRGLSVVGGERVTVSDVAVSDTAAAAVYVAAEKSWNTWAAEDVTVRGGTVTGANLDERVDHGAVLVYSGDPDQGVVDVTVQDLRITGTAAHASREVGVLADDGARVSGVRLERIAFQGPHRHLFSSNSASAGYELADWTADGRPASPRP